MLHINNSSVTSEKFVQQLHTCTINS